MDYRKIYSLVESEAFKYHAEVHKKHIFNISSVEEYKAMFPFMKTLGLHQVEMVATGNLSIEEIKIIVRRNYFRNYYKTVGSPYKRIRKDSTHEVWADTSIYNKKYKKGITSDTVKTNSKVFKKDLRRLELAYGRKI